MSSPPAVLGSRSCPNATLWRASCKRRTCPVCGVRWARDWFTSTRLNLEHYGAPVVVVAITAPGADRLPWDEDRCSHRRPHKHSGRNGCRVQDRALREWSDTAALRWGMLRRAATVATRRAIGRPPNLLERVWEPQKRGAPHLHVVLGYSPEDRPAARRFARELERLAAEYDFGYVDTALKPRAGREAAGYLAAYFLKGKRKDRITETVRNPHLPRGLLWLTPRLTRASGVSIRLLRRARHLWAALEGFCPAPRWSTAAEALLVKRLYVLQYRRPPPGDDGPRDPFVRRPELLRELEVLRELDDFTRATGARFVTPLAVAA